MVSVAFWVIALVGAAAVAVGIFPDLGGELMREPGIAAHVRTIGFVLVGVAFIVRSVGTRQDREPRQGRDSGEA